MKSSPLLRFNLVMILTVLLLAFSLGQLYKWASKPNQPSVDASLVLNTVQKLQQQQQPLQCVMTQEQQCEQALFIEYPAEYWRGAMPLIPGQVVAMQDSQGDAMLCSAEATGELLCINQLAWPDNTEHQLDLAYVFYFLLFSALFLLSRSLFRDIEILRSSALAEINIGKLPRFTLSKRSYLAPLAQSLRNMTARVEQLSRFQAEMAETVCHDIKTPLARLKFVSHLLQADNIADSRQQIENNVNDIENNVYDYLRLAENEYSEQHFDMQAIALAPLLKKLARPYMLDSAVSIIVQADTECTMIADAVLLSRAVNNLLGNAIRFASKQVVMCLATDSHNATITVEDDGAGWDGMPTAQQAVSVDNMVLHHGIGLAIVRQVVERHSGELQFSTSALGGAKVCICLPLHTDMAAPASEQ